METGQSLYQRLGGYDAIAAVYNDLLPRLMSDPFARALVDSTRSDIVEA